MPSIGVIWRFLTERGRAKLAEVPDGYTVRILSPESVEPRDLVDFDIVFSDCKPSMYREAARMRWLSTPMAGVAPYCDPALYPNPIVLTNSSGAYGVAISEHLLTMTLMLVRRMDQYFDQQRARGWGLIGMVRPVSELTVTVVGVGDIGSAYARHMKALGAAVRGVRRSPAPCPDYLDAIYTTDRLDEALAGADIVALALPGTAETSGILDRARLAALKPGCIVLNVGRGTAIDQDALVELLQSGRLGGAGLDVCDPEPLPPDAPLWDAPRLVLTPHVSGNNSTAYTLDRIVELFVENVRRDSRGEPLERVVDFTRGY